MSSLPRTLGRFGRLERFDGERIRGLDSVTDREAELVRVPFGLERRAERDAYVTLLRDRTTVVHPAIRAVLDGGEWDDDAFAALELLRGETALATWAERADRPAKARAAAEILAGADVLSARGLGLSGPVVVDDYGQPKILGLEKDDHVDAAAAHVRRVAEAASILEPDERAKLEDARGPTRDAIRFGLEREAREAPSAPFSTDVARGEAALAGAWNRQLAIGLAVLFAIAAIVAILLGALR